MSEREASVEPAHDCYCGHDFNQADAFAIACLVTILFLKHIACLAPVRISGLKKGKRLVPLACLSLCRDCKEALANRNAIASLFEHGLYRVIMASRTVCRLVLAYMRQRIRQTYSASLGQPVQHEMSAY